MKDLRRRLDKFTEAAEQLLEVLDVDEPSPLLSIEDIAPLIDIVQGLLDATENITSSSEELAEHRQEYRDLLKDLTDRTRGL